MYHSSAGSSPGDVRSVCHRSFQDELESALITILRMQANQFIRMTTMSRRRESWEVMLP